MLHELTDAWPIVLSLGGCAAYFIGNYARSKANDKEIVGLSITVEAINRTIAAIEEKVSRLQGDVRHADQRTSEACQDITELRTRSESNASNINYMLGRMDFGKNQRPGGPNDKR